MSYEPSLSDFHESFVRALTRHERVIRAYIRGTGITRPEDVDEIMQEVSLAAWKKFDQLDDEERIILLWVIGLGASRSGKLVTSGI